jgi:hypothetical protein
VNSFPGLLKNKGFKEERKTKVGLDAIDKSTTLESNKSLFDRLKNPAAGVVSVSNNPCQESISTWLLVRRFFDTLYPLAIDR